MQIPCKILIICIIWINISFSELYSQSSYSLKTYTTESGLAHNYVHYLAKDTTGFLWISTWNGVSRFDGYEFRNYYHKPGDSTSFPFFAVDKLLVDPCNNLWALCQQRPVVLYDNVNDIFKPIENEILKNTAISDLTLSPDKKVWLADKVRSRLYKYDPLSKNLTVFEFRKNKGLDLGIFRNEMQIIIDNRNEIWFVGNNCGVYKSYQTDGSTFKLDFIGKLPIGKTDLLLNPDSYQVYDIFIDQEGQTWIFSKFGLFIIEKQENKIKKYTEPVNPLSFKGKKYFIWSDGQTGTHILDTYNQSVSNIRLDPGEYSESILIDEQDVVWSGNFTLLRQDLGLKRFIKTDASFKHYLTRNSTSKDYLVYPIFKDFKNNIWVSTRNTDSLFFFGQDGIMKKISFRQAFGNKVFINPRVRAMVQDSTGIWLAGTENLLLYYSYETQKFILKELKVQGKNHSNEIINVRNMLKSDGDLFLNGTNGIYRYNIATEQTFFEFDCTYMPVYCMISDDKDGFWIGTQNNIISHLSSEFKVLETYPLGNDAYNVSGICLGDNNDLWVTLMGGGLVHLNPATGKFETYTTSDGLSDNISLSILKDLKGHLWISNSKGISMINPETHYFQNFGKNNGIQIEEFNPDSYFFSADGEIFFGGNGGFISFYPDSVLNRNSKEVKSRLVITDFKVSGSEKIFNDAIFNLDTFLLEKGDDNFQLTFAFLNLKNATSVKYRYSGLNNLNSWKISDYKNRNINYSNLKPGKYKIVIQASDETGEWMNSRNLYIIIPPFFYQTFLFKLFIVFIVISVLTVLFFMYLNQVKIKEHQKHNELKLESLRGQMNPHFIFNSLNSINYFISNNDKLSANHYIADFSRLIRSILNNLSHDYIPFEEEYQSLNDYLKLEHLRFGDKFDYEIDTKEIESDKYLIFPGMVQPFIENAIWHGVRGLKSRKGFIKVVFKPVNSACLNCIVEDNGIGRKKAQLYNNELPGKKSMGIGIVMERLQIASNLRKTNYNVTIEDCNPLESETGTRVTLNLPAKQK